MPLSQQPLSVRYMISQLGMLCLALLLLGLPVASYAKDITGNAEQGLVSHLDSLSSQGYLSRLAEIKKNSADDVSPDLDSPSWGIFSSSLHCLTQGSLVSSALQENSPSTTRSKSYLSPPLRAPPLS